MELLLVLVVALIVFGPSRLPEIGATIGRAAREFKRAQLELTQHLTRELEVESKPPIEKSRLADLSTKEGADEGEGNQDDYSRPKTEHNGG